MVKEKTKKKTEKYSGVAGIKNLVLHNDDFNTFDFVIETLVDVCKHEPEQAEQCAMIVHYKGKCAVKSGTLAKLKPMCDEMNNRGLSVTIN